MDSESQTDLFLSINNFLEADKDEEVEGWITTIAEIFVDPDIEIKELDLTRPGWKAVGEP